MHWRCSSCHPHTTVAARVRCSVCLSSSAPSSTNTFEFEFSQQQPHAQRASLSRRHWQAGVVFFRATKSSTRPRLPPASFHPSRQQTYHPNNEGIRKTAFSTGRSFSNCKNLVLFLLFTMGAVLTKLLEVFWTKKLDIVVIGLENSGKTTLLSVLAHGEPVETVPTIGLNVKVFKKGQVNMKCWDIGGQEQYRSEWSRYTKGCDVVLFVVDAAAPQKLGTAKKELHKLLDDGSIGSTPMLVLANKIDIQPHVGEAELIDRLQLNYVMETPWMVLPISALKITNIDQVVEWLTAQGK